MFPVEPLRGVITPNLTPFNDDLTVAEDLYVAHAKRCLEQGCVGLAPFGTTGEALSVGVEERLSALKALLDAGVEPGRLIPGTGLNNLPETADFSRACIDMGCAGVMTLPPFYFKGVPEDGLYAYFAKLIEWIDRDALKIYLYHIPQVAGVGIPPSLVARLKRDFPQQIVGIKDSSGDWENTKQLLEIEDLIVYPGSELPLPQALSMGAPGCISATANLNAGMIAEVIRLYVAGETEAADALYARMKTIRLLFQDYAPIPAQKRLLAMATGDARWANLRPPLLSKPEAEAKELAAKLESEAGFTL